MICNMKIFQICTEKTYLPRRNMRIEERRYAVIMYIQTSTDKGAMKENKFGGGGFFFL